MNTIQEHSDRIKALRGEKATLILDLRANRARRQMIDTEIEELRIKVKDIKTQDRG